MQGSHVVITRWEPQKKFRSCCKGFGKWEFLETCNHAHPEHPIAPPHFIFLPLFRASHAAKWLMLLHKWTAATSAITSIISNWPPSKWQPLSQRTWDIRNITIVRWFNDYQHSTFKHFDHFLPAALVSSSRARPGTCFALGGGTFVKKVLR